MNTERINRSMMVTPLLGLSFLVLAAGCTVEERTVVRAPRPRDRVEVVTVRPSPRHAWMGGRWEARGDRWEWIEGRWETR